MLTELTYTIDEELDNKAKLELLMLAIDELEPRDRKVLLLTFGIGVRPRTDVEIGESLGITRERVRQLRNRAFTRITKTVSYQKLHDYMVPLENYPPPPPTFPLVKNNKPRKLPWRPYTYQELNQFDEKVADVWEARYRRYRDRRNRRNRSNAYNW